MKYITLQEAEKVCERILKEYVPPTFNGQALFTLPPIDLAAIFGDRQRMNVAKLNDEIRRIIEEAIDKQ